MSEAPPFNELLSRIRAGDARAVEALARKYERAIDRVTPELGLDSEDREGDDA